MENVDKKILWAKREEFFNKVNETHRKFKKYYKKAKEQAGEYFFENFIRDDMAFYYAMENGETVFQYNAKCRGSEDLRQLSKEIIGKIKEYGKEK